MDITEKPLHRQTLVLPRDLHDAVARALKAAPPVRWMRAAQALSESYRTVRPADTAADTAAPLASGDDAALGYAALLLPATYAQLRGAMAALAARARGWQPQTLLDLGSGPGTALWAAVAQWPALHALTAYEREKAFIALGRTLAKGSDSAAVRAAHWQQLDLTSLAEETRRPGDNGARSASADGSQLTRRDTQYDLVIIGHVLNELGAEAQRALVAEAWRRTAGVLLIVEPGTSAAFPLVRAARDALLAEGAHTLAPCAHDRPCPLQNDFCHFPQRLKRPEFQRRARQAPSEWEDAKFAYAALARFPPDGAIAGRLIREPTTNKAYAEALVSAPEGIVRHQALKRNKAEFRAVKEWRWGDALDDEAMTR